MKKVTLKKVKAKKLSLSGNEIEEETRELYKGLSRISQDKCVINALKSEVDFKRKDDNNVKILKEKIKDKDKKIKELEEANNLLKLGIINNRDAPADEGDFGFNF